MCLLRHRLLFGGISLLFLCWGCSQSPKLDSNSETFSQDIFTYLYENRQKVNLCEGEIDQEVAAKNIQIYAIDQNTLLIEFLCFLGAYQSNYQYFLYTKNTYRPQIQPLTFEIFEVSEPQKIDKIKVPSLGGLSDYNSQQKTLTIVTKYRGLADCGSLGKYQWDGNSFKLQEYRLKANCDGQYIDPENYSQVYP